MLIVLGGGLCTLPFSEMKIQKKKKVYFNRGNLATGKVSSKNAYVEGNLLEIFKLLVNDQ